MAPHTGVLWHRRRAIRLRDASAKDAETIAFEEEQAAAVAQEPVKLAVPDSDSDSDDFDDSDDSGAAGAGVGDSDAGGAPPLPPGDMINGAWVAA